MKRRRDSEEAEEASGAAADLEAVADSGAADLVVEGSGAGWLAAASEVGLPVAASGAAYLLADSGEQASVAVVHWLWPVSAAERSWGVPGGVAGEVPGSQFDRVGVCGGAGAAVGGADVGQTQMLLGWGAVGPEDEGDGGVAVGDGAGLLLLA
jgi:hypothetical protein